MIYENQITLVKFPRTIPANLDSKMKYDTFSGFHCQELLWLLCTENTENTEDLQVMNGFSFYFFPVVVTCYVYKPTSELSIGDQNRWR